MIKYDTYKDMFIGITIFIGGMITVILLMKYFNTINTTSQTSFRALKPIKQYNKVENNKVENILEEIRDEIVEQTPIGEINNRVESITDQVTDLYDEAQKGLNWTSFDLTNNGPNPVYFSVNKWEWSESPIPSGQTINVDLKKRNAIKRIYLKCDSGQTASVSFYIVK